jgi:predicted alpha/beta-fold hydrolase
MRQTLLALWLILATQAAFAQDQLVVVPSRETQTISYWWMPTDKAVATVLLFSGGAGGIGYKDGHPTSGNFLVRSREFFRNEKLNVAILGNPSDKKQLDDFWRTSAAHLTDVSNVLDSIRKNSSQPIWAIGTSRGTISAAAVGIGLQEKLAGIVFTASMTTYSLQASVPKQKIDSIRLPVLVYHHKDDSCNLTLAHETDWIMQGLKNTPVKKQMIVTGGENPTGDPCEAFHWHGFIGMEARAVKDIAEWIKNPQP